MKISFLSAILGLVSRRPVGGGAAGDNSAAPPLAFTDSPAFVQWVSRVRTERRLPMAIDESALAWLAQTHPDRVAATIRAAQVLLQHRFTLLGAVDFVPQDPSRKIADSGYRPIDWHLDPVSGERFPTGFAHKTWNMQTMRPGNADIKLPWELARCQHWPTFGQAWQFTRDARFAREIFDQLYDFVEANPLGVGVNWVCTMDVAIRTANWAIGLQLIRDCDAIDDNDWKFAHRQLLAHGHFIRDNLEDKYEVTSNHFLSNVVGLLYVAAVCRDLPEGKEWLSWGVGMLEREIDVQVLDDGADFESSIPYHRLVIELFLGGLVVAEHAGRKLSKHYREKLCSMITYLLAMLRPDGLMPQIGDADDGRLHILSDYGRWNPQDARHLLAPAAYALGNPLWKAYSGDVGEWEAAWWGFAPTDIRSDNLPLPDCAKLFPHAGHAVSRAGGEYLLVSNAKVGTEGFGNHKHNDQLGFELHCNGYALIVDPGSHVYTGNPASRNRYRGTAFHNTLMIDGVEQNEVNPEWLFRLFEKANPEHAEFTERGTVIRYRGRHHGYTRLPDPVIHERTFEHHSDTGELTITDRLEGAGVHDLHWHFHLAPGVSVQQGESSACFLLEVECDRYVLASHDGLAGLLDASVYSPSYGVETPCQIIDFRISAEIVGQSVWRFSIRLFT